MPHAWSCSNQSSTKQKLSVIHALPKEENLNILSQNIYRKSYQRKKTYFFCSSQIEKNSIRSPKNKAFTVIGNFTKTLYQHYFRTRPKQTSGKVLIERIG